MVVLARAVPVVAASLVCLSAVLPVRAEADEDAEGWRPQVGLYFTSAVPMGAFGNRVDDPGFGLGLLAGVGLKGLPVFLGADVSFLDYGRESQREVVSTSAGSVNGHATTTNEIITGHLLLRLQPRSGRFRPYVEGLFGFKHLSTQSRVTVPGFDPSEPGGETTIASKTNLDDTALSYGPGAGLDVVLWSSEMGGPALHLDVGARYLFGERARYLKKGSVRREGNLVFFDVLESRTDMLTANLGVALVF